MLAWKVQDTAWCFVYLLFTFVYLLFTLVYLLFTFVYLRNEYEASWCDCRYEQSWRTCSLFVVDFEGSENLTKLKKITQLQSQGDQSTSAAYFKPAMLLSLMNVIVHSWITLELTTWKCGLMTQQSLGETVWFSIFERRVTFSSFFYSSSRLQAHLWWWIVEYSSGDIRTLCLTDVSVSPCV